MAKRVLFTCFNCQTCDLPFDAQHGGAHTPYVGSFDGKLLVACQTASFDDVMTPATWLINFLSHPAFTKTDGGYKLSGIPKIPRCADCDHSVNLDPHLTPYLLRCGHLVCEGCLDEYDEETCGECDASFAGEPRQKCDILLDFFKLLLEEKVDAQECTGCAHTAPMETLLYCSGCAAAVCGGCSNKLHAGHALIGLVDHELGQLRERSTLRMNDVFAGYGKLYKPLHSEIQRGIMTLMVAGGGKLADVPKQQYFADGTRITDEMERLLEDFSNECEIYMPVARKFNDRIMDFKEQLGVRGSQIDVRPSVEAAAAKEHPKPKKVVEAVAAQEPAAVQAAPAAAAVPSAGQVAAQKAAAPAPAPVAGQVAAASAPPPAPVRPAEQVAAAPPPPPAPARPAEQVAAAPAPPPAPARPAGQVAAAPAPPPAPARPAGQVAAQNAAAPAPAAGVAAVPAPAEEAPAAAAAH